MASIDNSGVTIEPVTDYEVDRPMGWPPGDQTRMIAAGTVFSISSFKSLIEDGRFEINP